MTHEGRRSTERKLNNDEFMHTENTMVCYCEDTYRSKTGTEDEKYVKQELEDQRRG